MKNDWMQIKTKQFDFTKLISTILILIVFELFCNWKTNLFVWKWVEQRQWKYYFHQFKMKYTKWAVCDIDREPFHKCECFVFGILLLNMLNSNMKKWKIHNFKQKNWGMFVFNETERSEQFVMWTVCYNREQLHTRGG